MISFIFFACSLLIPKPSWNVKPVEYDLMKSTLSTWRNDYRESSFEYNSTFEMIRWHATTGSKCCLGLYHNYELRALTQVFQSGKDVYLRSLITPEDEDVAGTILMYKVFNRDIKVDWEAIQHNPRWYIAALFIMENTIPPSLP